MAKGRGMRDGISTLVCRNGVEHPLKIELENISLLVYNLIMYMTAQSFHISQPLGSILLSSPAKGPWISCPCLKYLGPA